MVVKASFFLLFLPPQPPLACRLNAYRLASLPFWLLISSSLCPYVISVIFSCLSWQ